MQGGRSDVELNSLGREQAARLASFLRDEDLDAVVSSPLKRAKLTAEIIASQHELPIEVNEELKEIDVGDFEGVSLSTLPNTFSQLLMEWWRGGEDRLPGGESFVELQRRCWGVVESLLGRGSKEVIVIVSHYFVVLAIILKALDLPLGYLAKFKIDPAGLSILEFESYGARLVTLNDTSYLTFRSS